MELRTIPHVAGAFEKLPAERELARLPARERGHRIAVRVAQRIAQGPGIGTRLRGAGRGVGTDREGGIADEGDPPERHPRHVDVVDHLYEQLRGPVHDLRDGGRHVGIGELPRPGHVPGAHRSRGKGQGLAPPGAIGHQIVERVALLVVVVPDEVREPPAGFEGAVEAGDGIDEDVSGRQQVVGDGVAQRVEARRGEPGFGDRGPPRDVARVTRLGVGQQLRAGTRRDSVRAHQQVERMGRAALQTDVHPAGVLAEVDDLGAEVVAALVEAAHEPTVDGVPGREPVVHPLAVDPLPAPGEELQPRQLDLDPADVELARLVEVAGGCRMQPDAGSARFQRSPGALEHVDLAAQVAQHERGGEPSDRSADDPDAGHRVHPGALRPAVRTSSSSCALRCGGSRRRRFISASSRTRRVSPRVSRPGRSTPRS